MRFGYTIAYTVSKSPKKIEIWICYKGVFRNRQTFLLFHSEKKKEEAGVLERFL